MEELKHAIHVREIAEGKLVFMWLSCEGAVEVFKAKTIYWRINATTQDCTFENRKRVPVMLRYQKASNRCF